MFPQNDSYIKTGSDESHLNVSLIMRDKVGQCTQTTIFEKKGEPKRIRTEVLLLTSLTPYRWAKAAHNSAVCTCTTSFYTLKKKKKKKGGGGLKAFIITCDKSTAR